MYPFYSLHHPIFADAVTASNHNGSLIIMIRVRWRYKKLSFFPINVTTKTADTAAWMKGREPIYYASLHRPGKTLTEVVGAPPMRVLGRLALVRADVVRGQR